MVFLDDDEPEFTIGPPQLRVGDKISHASLGEGVVVAASQGGAGEWVEVAFFGGAGKKKLIVVYADGRKSGEPQIMNTSAIKTICLIMLGLCGFANAQAPTPTPQTRYVLITKEIPTKEDATPLYNLSLEDTTTKKVLWTKKFVGEPSVGWSKDRQAVAIIDQGGVAVWQVGEKLRYFGTPGDRDYTFSCLWSPDARHLLIRCGSSGMDDYLATVFCLRLGRGQTYKYFGMDSFVNKMRWKDNETVVYTVFDQEKMEWDKKPRTWRVPQSPKVTNSWFPYGPKTKA